MSKVNYRTGSNAPITSVGLNDDGRAIYCCGDASGNQTSTECADGDPPFMLEDADMVLGRAALADVTSIAGNDSGLGTDGGNSSGGGSTGDHGTCPHSSSTCHSTAIGTGVGVPLGLLGLSAIAWALFERRRGRAGGKARTVAGPGPGDAIARGSEKTPISFQRNSEPRELDMSALSNARENTLLHGSPLSEMMGSEAKQ
ncbi:uncharacterized protein BDV14DRAFT_197475 [Aspergillus stella-maris]|uniref:uncharacterized protein n=1 Tax=Aspergillus stella-maris TaxID=1810926 RepID=UPI003CCDE272